MHAHAVRTPPLPQIVRNILEAHSSMLNLTLMEARVKYIRNWMALQDFGVALFLVRFHRAKKDVSGGVAMHVCS